MDGLFLSPAPEPQNSITDPANTMANIQPGNLGEEFKDETTKKKIKPPALVNRKLKAKKKEILNNDEASTSSSSSSTSNTNSTRRVSRASHRLRKPRVRLGMARRSVVERQAEALALGMSIATFTSLVRSERSFNSTLGILNDQSKVEVGVSRAERLKTELEDKLKVCLARIYIDWLVVSVINTLVWTSYGAYVFSAVFSQERIMERGIPMCKAFEEQMKQGSLPVINLICRHQVWLQMNFPVLMILVVTYLIIRRSSATKQRMSSIFYLLFLDMVCGLSGKLFVDTLGGNGELWLSLWGRLCLLHYATVRFITWAVFGLLTRGTKPNTLVMLLRWAHRSIFFGLVLALPLINGLLPFATFSEWIRISSVATNAIRGGLGL